MVLEQGYIKGDRDAVEGRDLVDTGTSGKENACWGVLDVLYGEQAIPLYERPFYLAYINGRVQTPANVHHYICPKDLQRNQQPLQIPAILRSSVFHPCHYLLMQKP